MSVPNELDTGTMTVGEARIEAVEKRVRDTERNARRREFVLFIITVLSGLAAVGSVFYAREQIEQSSATARRDVWNQFLLRFDDDKMWEARKNILEFKARLRRNARAPKEPEKFREFMGQQSQAYLSRYVYSTADSIPDDILLDLAEQDRQKYFEELDQSRRRIKNFYQSVMLFIKDDPANEKVLKDRWNFGTVTFLESDWLPVEHGQNAALHGSQSSQSDEDAVGMVDWYKTQLSKK
jgi:hypothetical protein